MIEKNSEKVIVCLCDNTIQHKKKNSVPKFPALLFFKLNLVSKCRKMNSLYCGIIKIMD